jgi:hypothetical protein
VNAIVFLTDGQPTWPVTSNFKNLLDTVKIHNTSKAEIFTFGIGDQVVADSLTLLGKQNAGFATMILADDSINVIMQSFMNKISFPLLKNLAAHFSGLSAYDVYPNTLPNLYAGTQLTVLGRYRTTGEYPITVKGSRGLDSLTLKQTLSFPSGAFGIIDYLTIWQLNLTCTIPQRFCCILTNRSYHMKHLNEEHDPETRFCGIGRHSHWLQRRHVFRLPYYPESRR